MFNRDVMSGYDYVKIRTVKMVGLLLNVFCKRKHVPFLKEMAASETRTGLLGLWVKLLFLICQVNNFLSYTNLIYFFNF